MFNTHIYLTIHAETDGDRKRFFQLIEKGSYGNILNATQTDEFIYQFLIDTYDKLDYVRRKLQSGGVYVLEVRDNEYEVVWRNKKYNTSFPARNKTAKKLRRLGGKKVPAR